MGYVALEKTLRDLIVENPFTKIQGLPAWLQKTQLIEEMKEGVIRCAVSSYPWAGDYRLLAVIDGQIKSLTQTVLVCVLPEKPILHIPKQLDFSTGRSSFYTWCRLEDVKKLTPM